MKKIFLSLGTILVAAGLLVGGTGAFLASTQTSTGNTFASGVIDLKVDNESYITNDFGKLILSTSTSWSLSPLAGKFFFNFNDVKPGDIGEDTISLHVNNNNAWACMNVNLTATPENGQSEPEALIDPTIGPNDGELQNNLYFAFWADDGDNVYEKGEKIFKQGLVKDIFNGQNWPLADSQANIWTGHAGDPIIGDTTRYIGKAWCFGSTTPNPINQDNLGKTGSNGPLVRGTGFLCNGADVGNIVQSDGIKADVTFSVAQSRNNDSYTCNPGDPHTPPTSTSTLFSDDFGGCSSAKNLTVLNDPKWNQTGTVGPDNHGNPHGLVANLIGPTGSITTTSINTVGYHNIVLSYDRNLDVPAGAPMTLTAQYSPDNGTTWTTLETFNADSAWTTKTFSLSPAADNKPNVKIRFSIVGTNTTDHAYIDNVNITGVSP